MIRLPAVLVSKIKYILRLLVWLNPPAILKVTYTIFLKDGSEPGLPSFCQSTPVHDFMMVFLVSSNLGKGDR